MQKFKVTFYLRLQRANPEGKVPVCIRLYLNGKRDNAGNTGVMVDPNEWNARLGRVTGKTNAAYIANRDLELLSAEYLQIFRKLEFDEHLSLELIKQQYKNSLAMKSDRGSVMTFIEDFIADAKLHIDKTIVYATWIRYDLTARQFKSFLKTKMKRSDLHFNEVDYKLIVDFERFLRLEIGYNNNNTVMKKMSMLKTIFIEAQNRGEMTQNPFFKYKIRFDATDRGFLTDEELEAIINLKLDIPRIDRIRDIFVFSCFTGLAYIDVANLTQDNIVKLNGRLWIMTRRQKTDVPSNIPLLDIPLQIIKKYEGKTKNGKLLPVPSAQKVNSYLKEIADLAKIQKNVTFHLARHTFATMAISKGMPIETVSKLLGHTNIQTTQIYARITNKKVEEDMLALGDKLDIFKKEEEETSDTSPIPTLPSEHKPKPSKRRTLLNAMEEDAEKKPLKDEDPEPAPKRRGRPPKNAKGAA